MYVYIWNIIRVRENINGSTKSTILRQTTNLLKCDIKMQYFIQHLDIQTGKNHDIPQKNLRSLEVQTFPCEIIH